MPTYPLAFPMKSPSSERLTIERNQAIMVSPHNFATQTIDNASRWNLEWTWPQMRHSQAMAISGWLDGLNGQIGTFRYWPENLSLLRLTGRTLAVPGYAYNTSISAAGWASGAASSLRVGQYFQVGQQLLRIVSAAATADAQGCVLIEFAPQLRVTFPTGTAINFVDPSGLFRLTASSGTGYTLDTDRMPTFGNLTAVEVVA